MTTKVEIKQASYITRIYWQNINSGTVTVTLQKENGVERELYQSGVNIQRAESVGERLLQTLKVLY